MLSNDKTLRAKTVELLAETTSMALDQATFLQAIKDHDQYGFCLIRLEWASANVAVCHFGFYQVNPKMCCSFIAHTTTVLSKSLYKVFDKQLASLMD